MSDSYPLSHRALVLTSFEVKTIPTPTPTPGNAIVQILAADILSYHREIYNGERKYGFPLPIVGGYSAIGRVKAVAEDATLLKPGQLVFVDCVIRARDDPTARYLTAISDGWTEGSKKLINEVWRDGAFAEFMKAPLENCIPLDEARLCGTLGYSVEDLMYMGYLLVPFGGLRDINVEPGETVVVSPAMGGFGGAGVLVAAAMGARVVAMGRNERELARLKAYTQRNFPGAEVEVVRITADEEKDATALRAFGTIDAVLDLTPPSASQSTHLKNAISVLRQGGRVSLMGFSDLSSSMWHIVGNDLALKGKLMYSREDMLLFVKMFQRGRFPSGEKLVDTKVFGLEQWKEALDVAAEHAGIGKSVVFKP